MENFGASPEKDLRAEVAALMTSENAKKQLENSVQQVREVNAALQRARQIGLHELVQPVTM